MASLLKDVVATQVFRVLSEFKSKLTLETEDDDLITISATVAEFSFVYPLLSSKPEGLLAEMNREMDATLLTQMMEGLSGDNAAEWNQIMEFITAHKGNYLIQLDNMIQNGKDFIG